MLRTIFANRYQVINGLPIIGKQYTSDVSSINMAYDVFGDDNSDKNGPPLIVMHGLLGSKQNWRGMSRALAQKLERRIFSVDARNHGESPHTSEHSSALMAADIKALMKSQNIHKACVLGHSMGGRTMMYFSLKYPELVDRAIIVDISPENLPANFTNTQDIMREMQNVQIPNGISPAEARQIAEKHLIAKTNDPGTIAFVLLNLKQRNSGEYYWAANVDVLGKSISFLRNFMDQVKVLTPYNGPVLFICGTESKFVSKSDEPSIKQLFPAVEIKWLKAGHLVHFDQPQQFMDSVVDFVQK